MIYFSYFSTCSHAAAPSVLMRVKKQNKTQQQVYNWTCGVFLFCSYLFFSFFFFLSDVLKELDDAYERYRRESDSLQRRKLQLSIQRALIRSQELGDEKIQIAGQMVRGRKTRQKSSFRVLMCVLMKLRYPSSVTYVQEHLPWLMGFMDLFRGLLYQDWMSFMFTFFGNLL